MPLKKHQTRQRRKNRIRAKVFGTPDRPRLTVYCSLTKVYAQLVDDTSEKTLASAASKKGKSIKEATDVGATIAAAAKKLKVHSIVFDRNGRKYHGRVKALADAVREAGITF